MASAVINLQKEYRSALKDFLRGGGEKALKNAYMLGRQSFEQHLGVLDIVAVHHQALASLLSTSGELPANKKVVKQASDFLAECLSPFEMAQRGFQESNAGGAGERRVVSYADRDFPGCDHADRS